MHRSDPQYIDLSATAERNREGHVTQDDMPLPLF